MKKTTFDIIKNIISKELKIHGIELLLTKKELPYEDAHIFKTYVGIVDNIKIQIDIIDLENINGIDLDMYNVLLKPYTLNYFVTIEVTNSFLDFVYIFRYEDKRLKIESVCDYKNNVVKFFNHESITQSTGTMANERTYFGSPSILETTRCSHFNYTFYTIKKILKDTLTNKETK